MKIALIALDLDDTLLRSDLSISEANRLALQEAENAGIEIVLASGRNYVAMEKYVRFLGLDRPGNYLICSNGAETLEADSEKIVEKLMIPESLCHEVAADIEAHGFPWQTYMGGKIYCSEVNPWAQLDEQLSGQTLLPAPDKETLFRDGQIKFVIPGEPDRIAGLCAEFAECYAGRAEVVTSKPYFLEILPLGADKGSALRRLADKLDIPMEKVMAVGDAMNDMGMLKAAGWSCAPANAIDPVKAAVRIVSGKTNEEDAVADLILSVALGKRYPETA
jgi:Cof subfamily protein (haloacid dehalogenase superfamily)